MVTNMNHQPENFVLITGAAKGIGRASALQMAGQGWRVFAGVRRAEDGVALQQPTPGKLTPLLLDVTDAGQIAQAAQAIAQQVGDAGLAGLVNNAGIVVPGPLEFLPLDEFRRQLEINLIGQLAVTQAVLPLIRQARGRIVNISSIGGLIAGPLLGPYHASKFALEALTDTLRLELKPWGIEVVAIEPGAIATPIWETGAQAADRMIAQMPVQVQALYGKAMTARRASAARQAQQGAPPQIVADAIAHALSAAKPQTRYVVGRDARFAARFIAWLPDRLRDRLILARRG
jgi:NAD(P)-dependent dehydrogenase (short-subunit alcohol dehydrogenase family)